MRADECRPRRESTADNAAFVQRHEYDPISGWCAWGCGCRSDGRIIKVKSGDVIYDGRGLSADEKTRFAAFAKAENERLQQEAAARGRQHYLTRSTA